MILVEIKSRYNKKILFSTESESVKSAVVSAIRAGADLGGAYLRGADLRGADLRGAYLRGAYLGGADLRGAELRGADLRGAYLRGAYLRGADLRVKAPPINDQYFTSEILFRSAKTEAQKNFSARVRIELNLCWEDFYALAKKMRLVGWAKVTLCVWQEYANMIKQITSKQRR